MKTIVQCVTDQVSKLVSRNERQQHAPVPILAAPEPPLTKEALIEVNFYLSQTAVDQLRKAVSSADSESKFLSVFYSRRSKYQPQWTV